MKKMLFTLFALGLMTSAMASPRVTTSGKYVYIVTPLNEMTSADKRESLEEANKFLLAELENLFPFESTSPTEVVKALELKKAALDQVVLAADNYLKNDEPGVRPYDLVPSAVMVIFGGGFSKQFVLNISGSFNIGLVIMPSMVKRITKGDATKTKKYYTFECSIVFLPVGNIGVGMSAEAAEKWATQLRVGAGLIFGEMIQPSDFYGLTAGISAASTIGPDFQGQLLGVVNNKGPTVDANGMKFVFANLVVTKGAQKKLEVVANIGFVKPLTSFMRAYDAISGNFVGGANLAGTSGLPTAGTVTNPSMPSTMPSPSIPSNPGAGRGPFQPIPSVGNTPSLTSDQQEYLNLQDAMNKLQEKKREERANNL